MPNFLCVALALHELGYKPVGIRLDSGDLAYLSKQTRAQFVAVAEKYNIPEFKKLSITASNDINEAVLNSLNEQVTCTRPPPEGFSRVNDVHRLLCSATRSMPTALARTL